MDNVKSKIIAVVIVAGLITVGISIPLFLKDDTPPNGNGDTPGDDTPNDPPVLIYSSPLTNPTINEGETQDFGVNVTDLNNDILVYQWTLNDSNVGTNSANYSYISNFDSAGNYSVKVRTSDGKAYIEKSWNLTVNNVNRAPVLSNPNPSSDPIINEGENQEFNITATDPDLDSLTYHWTENGSTVGSDSDIYLQTTNPGDAGDYEIKVNVTDGEIYMAYTWILHVSSVNSAPQLSNPNPNSDPTIYETASQEFNITATDGDSDPLTYV